MQLDDLNLSYYMENIGTQGSRKGIENMATKQALTALRTYQGDFKGVNFNRLILAASATNVMHKDIATALGCSKSSVGNYIRRANDDQVANPDSYKVGAGVTVQKTAPAPLAGITIHGITLADLFNANLVTQAEIDALATPQTAPAPVASTPVNTAKTYKRGKAAKLAPVVVDIYSKIIANDGAITQGDLGAIFGKSGSWAGKILVDAEIRVR